MDIVITDEIIKVIVPALCGIVGVIAGVILKSMFDWMLESKKLYQQRRFALYEKRREASEELYSLAFECFSIITENSVRSKNKKFSLKN